MNFSFATVEQAISSFFEKAVSVGKALAAGFEKYGTEAEAEAPLIEGLSSLAPAQVQLAERAGFGLLGMALKLVSDWQATGSPAGPIPLDLSTVASDLVALVPAAKSAAEAAGFDISKPAAPAASAPAPAAPIAPAAVEKPASVVAAVVSEADKLAAHIAAGGAPWIFSGFKMPAAAPAAAKA